LWALRWYSAFPVSYRDFAAMLSDLGVAVDHSTPFRRVPAYAARHWSSGPAGICGRAPTQGRVNKTDIKIRDAWTYLYRAVDSLGPDDRLPAVSAARRGCCQPVLPQGAGKAAHRQPADDPGDKNPAIRE